MNILKKYYVLLLFAASLLAVPTVSYGQIDRDIDNDGQWDHDKGGIDRDLDNDGQWDSNAGGIDRDQDNDGQWDR